MSSFRVARYAVQTGMQRHNTSAGVQTHAERSLLIYGTPEPDGTAFREALHFSTLFEPWYSRPIVGEVDFTEPASPTITAWFPLGEFQSFYDILRSEEQVYLVFVSIREAAGGYLRRVALGTMETDAE
jgi:hypothetical protein